MLGFLEIRLGFVKMRRKHSAEFSLVVIEGSKSMGSLIYLTVSSLALLVPVRDRLSCGSPMCSGLYFG